MLTVVQLPTLVKTWAGDRTSLERAVNTIQQRTDARLEIARLHTALMRRNQEVRWLLLVSVILALIVMAQFICLVGR